MIPHTRLGVTRSKANSATLAGRGFHAYIDIRQHRPPLAGIDYVATPIHEDSVTLYSFRTPDDRDAFVEQFGAEAI